MSEIQASTGELIPIREHGGKQAVSGRELHEFLQIGRDYSNWFKQMVEYGFTEGQDFTPISAKSTGGRPSIDHAITLDMAKELGMIQRTELGRQIRQYFIEVEKWAKGTPAIDLSTPQGVLALAEQLTTTARQLVAVTARAEVAEEFKEAIELNDGITPREFHKKYLPGCTETEFNAALYRHRLLIDQTGQRGRDSKGRIKNGKQHRHPTYQGKAFFYLHSELDRDKIRREHVRVIPGEAELLLVKWCAARGLISNGLAVAS